MKEQNKTERGGNLHYSMAGHYIDTNTTHPSSLHLVSIEKSQQPTISHAKSGLTGFDDILTINTARVYKVGLQIESWK